LEIGNEKEQNSRLFSLLMLPALASYSYSNCSLLLLHITVGAFK